MVPIPPPDVAVIKFAKRLRILESFPYRHRDTFKNIVVFVELQDEEAVVAVAAVEVGVVDEGAFGGVDGFGDRETCGFDGGDGLVVGGEVGWDVGAGCAGTSCEEE
ncbi:MAG: hypothetical protein RLZZ519_3135 [Bacteroidota bacterium]